MSESSFGGDVLHFWGLDEDTLSSLPLQFARPEDFNLLVKTQTIESMKDMENQIERSSYSIPVIVQGNRGSGKSTVMRYLFKLIETRTPKKSDTLTIYCNNLDLDDTDFRTIKYGVHSDFLTRLVALLPIIRNEKGVSIQGETALKAIAAGNIHLIDGEIESLFTTISRIYRKTVVFIDNLDKAASGKYETYEHYFRKDQGFYELLHKRLGFVFISVQRYMAARFRRNVHVNYLMGGRTVGLGPWSEEDLDKLLSVRFRIGSGSKKERSFHLGQYLDRKALDMLYSLNDYNPRWVLLATKQLMNKAAELNKDPKSLLPLKPIRGVFVRAYIEEAKGVRGIPEFRKFDLIDTIVIRQHSKALETVKNCMRKNEAHAWDLIYTLIGIWRNKTTDDKAMANILRRHGVINQASKTTYEVNSLVENLLEYLYRTFDQDLDSVRYYFVRTPP